MSDPLVTDNIALIEQGVKFLSSLSRETFVARAQSTLGASIGGHVRHNIDHYMCFIGGIDEGRIDYDARARLAVVETDPAVASEALRDAAARLRELNRPDLARDVEVRMDTGDAGERPWTRSSVRRELQFLLSHTVHHYALVAMICRLFGVDVPENFGVAPSTLKHRLRAAQACAR